MRLIGLVTFPPVNLRLVSKGKDGFAEVMLPPLQQWLSHVSAGCRFRANIAGF